MSVLLFYEPFCCKSAKVLYMHFTSCLLLCAEEARLRAEREEQERLEQERKQKEIERLELKVSATESQKPNTYIYKKIFLLVMSVFILQDSERREGELDELRHLLEYNHNALTKWKSEAVEKDRVSCL